MATKELRKKNSQQWLRALARFSFQHWPRIIAVWLVLTAFFAFFALKLQQKTTIKDLLPAHNLVVQRFEDTVRDFQLIDRIVIAIECDPDDMEIAQSFADLLVEQTRQDERFPDYLKWINANLFDQIKESDYYRYLQYLPRMLPADKVEEFCKRLQPEQIDARFKQNFKDLESGMASKSLIEKDPLSLLDLAVSYKEEITGNYHLDLTGGYLTSRDQTILLVLARPVESNENVDFAVNAMKMLGDSIQNAKKQFAEEEGQDALSRLNIGLTGAHAITSNENATIKADVVSMFISSFLLVIFLFILAYGRPMAILYVGVPLISAEVWTLGISYFLFGRLNLLTATFSAVIVGLGIDFAIHIYSRYLDERTEGSAPCEAMECSLAQTGLGTIIAGSTTGLAFLAMGIGHFKGLFEFSVIASLGIFLCLAHMFVLLPTMVFFRERIRGEKWKPRTQHGFHSEKLIVFFLKSGKWGLAAFGVFTLFMLYYAVQLRFNPDLRSIRAKSNPAIELQSRVTAKVGGSLRSLTFVMEAKNEADLYRMQKEMNPVLSQMKADGKIARFDTALNFIQEPARQEENMRIIAEHGIQGPEFEQNFLNTLERERFRVTPDHQNYAHHLSEGLSSHEPVTLAELVQSEGSLLRQFLQHKDGHYKAVTYIYPAKGLWEKKTISAMTNEILQSVTPGEGNELYVTGLQVLSDEIKFLVEDSFLLSCILALSLVLGILIFHFRKLSLIVLTLSPLIISIIWMLGTMVLLGIDINLLNFVATPLIIGIGIDDGVHIVEKYLHRKKGQVAETMASCAKAVTLTSMTTVFGFSSLFMADYSGFHSLGASAILGVAFSWFASVTLLPLLMETFKIRFVRAEH